MSYVDNLILTVFLLDDDDARAKRIESFDLGGNHFVHVNSRIENHGSGKVLEHDVFVMAANYLDWGRLVTLLKDPIFDEETPEDPGRLFGARESIRLSICRQQDDHFSMYTVDEFLALDAEVER